jgi:hypothetical protein
MLTTELKSRIVTCALKHEEKDGLMFRQGAYEARNGNIAHCSIGCVRFELGLNATVGNHGELVEPTGVPEVILRLSDNVFEGLEESESIVWTRRLWAAIPENTNLVPRSNEIIARLMDMLAKDAIRDDTRAAAQAIAVLYRRRRDGDEPSDDEWKAAEHQAYAAWQQTYAARPQADAAWQQADAARQQADAAWQQADAARQQADAAWQQADAARQQFWSRVADIMVDVLQNWTPATT